LIGCLRVIYLRHWVSCFRSVTVHHKTAIHPSCAVHSHLLDHVCYCLQEGLDLSPSVTGQLDAIEAELAAHQKVTFIIWIDSKGTGLKGMPGSADRERNARLLLQTVLAGVGMLSVDEDFDIHVKNKVGAVQSLGMATACCQRHGWAYPGWTTWPGCGDHGEGWGQSPRPSSLGDSCRWTQGRQVRVPAQNGAGLSQGRQGWVACCWVAAGGS
jgi:hypothetical protein